MRYATRFNGIPEQSAAFELPVEDRAVVLDLAVEIGGALELHR